MASFPNESDLSKLRALNETLAGIERRFHTVALGRIRDLARRVDDPKDWLADFEAELVVDLYLGKGDPAWDDDKDNLLSATRVDLKRLGAEPDFGFGALTTDHSEGERMDVGPQCWLFHHFLNHAGLDCRDLIRARDAWVDLVVTEQFMTSVLR